MGAKNPNKVAVSAPVKVGGIAGIHLFTGHPAQFWPAFLAYVGEHLQTEKCWLLGRKKNAWTLQLEHPTPLNKIDSSDLNHLKSLAQQCWQQGSSLLQTLEKQLFIAQKLMDAEGQPARVLVVGFANISQLQIEDKCKQLQLLADAPLVYQQSRNRAVEQHRRADFAQILEFLTLLNQQDSFLEASMSVVNEVVSLYGCERVSLGWERGGYVRLQCISHMEQFESKMELVSQLEATMEEAFDQDEEIIFPVRDVHGPVARDHQEYAQALKIGQLLSLPLRIGQQPVGVLTCERNTMPFDDEDVRSLRILCDQISPRLADKKSMDRWFGARALDALKKSSTSVFGVEKTLLKLSVFVFSALLLASVIVKLPYRVEAPFLLKSKDVRQITAPFAGYIEQVDFEIGQWVNVDQPLVQLDASELLLEEAAALAHQVRFEREAEKARAKNALIDMKIASAKARQAEADLQLIQHHLNQSQLRSPIDGLVVEGDLLEKRGAPVEKGALLLKIAGGKRLYAEIKIAETEMQDIVPKLDGEIAFVSRPQEKFPFLLQQIDPVASQGQAGNSFIARSAEFSQVESWWRPGMTGIAKISAGERSILWLVSHRTIRFLRLLVWW